MLLLYYVVGAIGVIYILDWPMEPFPSGNNPPKAGKDENGHDDNNGIIWCVDVISSNKFEAISLHVLISAASGDRPEGKNNMMTINATHETATAPIGIAHRPRLNGPGTSLVRPDVILKKMGAA